MSGILQYCGVRPSSGCGRVARVVRRWSRGFCVALPRRSLSAVRFLDALSAGTRLSGPAPCRFTYCESLLRWWVGSLQVSIALGVCSLVLSCSSVSPSLSGLPQLELRALTVVSPFHYPTVFPNPDACRSHIYSVDSFTRWFIARQCSHQVFHVHTESNTLSGRSHPSVASYLTVSSRRSGYLSQRLKAVVWPSPYCPYISVSLTQYS